VGLVGAGLSDHPDLDAILQRLVERGLGAATSSLRVAGLTERRLRLLAAAGARRITVGVDGLSERLRRGLGKPIAGRAVVRLAEAARDLGLEGLKLYVMVGLPGEGAADAEEFERLVREVARRVRVGVSASPLVPKPGTPCASWPLAPARVLRERLADLRRRLAPVARRVDLGSPRTAAREHALAHARLAEVGRLLGLGG
jgi:radical SAM superfamily enzyme YgiQ (UPF0313 family)